MNKTDPQELTLGLAWHCPSDKLSYKHRSVPTEETTTHHIYRVLASQYDPLGYILPFTTMAKILVQTLWTQGPQFLQQTSQCWPVQPTLGIREKNELKKSMFCAHVAVASPPLPDPTQNTT